MERLTAKQRDLLGLLKARKNPPSARQVADALQTPGYRRPLWSYDAVISSLRRIERRGLCAGVDTGPVRWTITKRGIEALDG